MAELSAGSLFTSLLHEVFTCLSSNVKAHLLAFSENRCKGGMRCPAPLPVGNASGQPNPDNILDIRHSLSSRQQFFDAQTPCVYAILTSLPCLMN